jgi:hypothetical protein
MPLSDHPNHVARMHNIAHRAGRRRRAAVFVHMGIIVVNWLQAQRVYQPILAAMEHLPDGAREGVLAGVDNFPYLANPPLDHVPNMAAITSDAYMDTLFPKAGKQELQVAYGSTTPFSVDPSQTFRMDKDEIGRVNPFPAAPLDRFDYLLLISQRYFVHDYPARLSKVFEKDAATLFRVAPGKGP